MSHLLRWRSRGGLSKGGQSASWNALALDIKFAETVSRVQPRQDSETFSGTKDIVLRQQEQY